MNKFTKISATALLALFLTACDKPADKAAEAKPEAAQTQAVSEVKVDEKGDYQKLVDWNKRKNKHSYNHNKNSNKIWWLQFKPKMRKK